MKYLFGWVLAIVLGIAFWSWVGVVTAWGLLRKKLR